MVFDYEYWLYMEKGKHCPIMPGSLELLRSRKAKPLPVARNLRFRDSHIAYNSNGSIGEGRFRLLYTLQYNKPLTEGVPDDLPVFINDIRKHQEQTIKVVKSSL